MTVWVPYRLEGVLEPLASRQKVLVWNGREEPRHDPAEVEFYVQPYTFATNTIDIISKMTSLRVVQTLTAGVDHIAPAVPDGVMIANARGVHDASTAELALALTLASQRNIDGFVRDQDDANWSFDRYPSLADRNVTIVGYGSIGQAIHRRLEPFEVDVTPVASTARDGVRGIAEILEILPSSEIVILVVPRTPETVGLVDEEFLAAMPDDSLLVNVARGVIVDTDALMAEEGRIRAALDVADPEPLPPEHPLWSRTGTIITPHVGGNTNAFLPRALRLIRDQVTRWLDDEPIENVISGSTT
ncbi:MAG: dihydrofolate reductase [Acidimicrobiia bacterium]|nr:dihydrofolate reductase [Acidimicrobiia bacterium]